eukprot:m.25070 g.25070  ORF g.25070 m.25070 type:complete len:238 (-) comp9166_c0_seq1:116-829(-)
MSDTGSEEAVNLQTALDRVKRLPIADCENEFSVKESSHILRLLANEENKVGITLGHAKKLKIVARRCLDHHFQQSLLKPSKATATYCDFLPSQSKNQLNGHSSTSSTTSMKDSLKQQLQHPQEDSQTQRTSPTNHTKNPFHIFLHSIEDKKELEGDQQHDENNKTDKIVYKKLEDILKKTSIEDIVSKLSVLESNELHSLLIGILTHKTHSLKRGHLKKMEKSLRQCLDMRLQQVLA